MLAMTLFIIPFPCAVKTSGKLVEFIIDISGTIVPFTITNTIMSNYLRNKSTLKDRLKKVYSSVNWSRIRRKLIYNKQWMRIYLDDYQRSRGDIVKEFVRVKSEDYVGVLPYDPTTGELVLIAEYHRGVDEVLVQLPSGKIKKGQTPLQAAKSELREETGLSGRISPLSRLWEMGMFFDAKAHFFFAEVDVSTMAKQTLDANEEIAIIVTTVKEIYELIFSKNRKPIDGALTQVFLTALESGLIDRKYIKASV